MKSIAQIAAELQGYDPQALSADAVGEFLARLVAPVAESEEVRILDALDRVLAEDIVSPISVPPHDNSAMDGYAFDGAQLGANAPLELEVVGTALAGKAWRGQCGPGQCVKIMTGAIMPAGLDTVVPQEFVTVQVDPSPVRTEPASPVEPAFPARPEPASPVRPEPASPVRTEPAFPVRPEPVEGPASTGSARTVPRTVITIPPGILHPGDNRRHKGEDLAAGMPALSKGERLGPAACGLVASLGLATVRVVRRLRVAYFSTGDEILSLGEPPREGAVYDSNRYTVHGLLARLGCEVIDLGVVRDEPSHLEDAFRHAAARADAIITSGGVSVGEADFTKAMMKQLGDVAFWKVAMRPGRPMAVGRIPSTASTGSGQAGAVLFGLPGNPVAVMVTFLAFVRPALLRMMGARDTAAPLLKARSAEAMRKKPGRTEYQRGIVTAQADGSLQVRITGNQGSGVLSSMVQANGLVVLHHAQGNVAPGDEVDVMMFDGAI